MTHLTEEELILHYYGEESETLALEQHLDHCESCRHLYGSLQRVLNVVDSAPVPERGPEYESQVWERIAHEIPAVRRPWILTPWLRWAAAAAACSVLMCGAFFAGRSYPAKPKASVVELSGTDPHTGNRVLLVALSDYLERSQMVLVELANTPPEGRVDISAQQERVEDLVSESRLYRQTADRVGDPVLAGALEDLDRVLLEVAHAPSHLSAGELDSLRERLKAEGILFKIRVLGATVRNEEEPAATDRKRL
jgi:hypothetical protein